MEYREILEAIQSSRELGLSDDIIRQNLINSKFDEGEINKAFIFLPRQDDAVEVPENLPPYAPPLPVPPQQPNPLPMVAQKPIPTLFSSLAWAKLMQVFLFISLYLLSISSAFILFFDIDKWFPNPSYPYFSTITTFINYWQAPLLRAEASMLLISLLIFSYTFLWNVTHQQIMKVVRNTISTKFFLYLTFTIYGLIILASLVFSLFNIFNETMAMNIFGHVFIAFILSVAVLYGCLQQMKQLVFYE
jgi:hypothetical protein